jgi:membrane associated rhomboid family serine protease
VKDGLFVVRFQADCTERIIGKLAWRSNHSPIKYPAEILMKIIHENACSGCRTATRDFIMARRKKQSIRKTSGMSLGRGFEVGLASIVVLVVAEWIDWLMGHTLDLHGILPRQTEGLPGVLWSPLLHAHWAHLAANAGPLALLLAMLFAERAYRPVQSLAMIWLVSGLGTWMIGRPAIHIGASSLVYGLVTYLLTATLWMKSWRAFLLSLIVLALFGGLFHGLLRIEAGVSWEGHLSGVLAGVWVAWLIHGR